ncbi:hypothetical protein SCYAM73S_01111 [Streptomyces cyaneofuscatus]
MPRTSVSPTADSAAPTGASADSAAPAGALGGLRAHPRPQAAPPLDDRPRRGHRRRALRGLRAPGSPPPAPRSSSRTRISGLLVMMVMRMLGEMSAANPASGSFSVHAERAIGPSGRVHRGLVLLVPALRRRAAWRASAAAQIVSGWLPGTPEWAWVALFMVVFLGHEPGSREELRRVRVLVRRGSRSSRSPCSWCSACWRSSASCPDTDARRSDQPHRRRRLPAQGHGRLHHRAPRLRLRVRRSGDRHHRRRRVRRTRCRASRRRSVRRCGASLSSTSARWPSSSPWSPGTTRRSPEESAPSTRCSTTSASAAPRRS